MYKLADEHLVALTESLHQVIGDACKTYVEDAIIRFKQEVYHLFDPETGNDAVPETGHENATECPNIFIVPGYITQNKNIRKEGKYSDGKLPQFRADERVLTVGYRSAEVGSSSIEREQMVISTLGNMYWYKYTTQDSIYVCITGGEHITNTPLSPLFAAIIKTTSDSKNIARILDMNRKYYYLLAKDAGGEIIRREKELAQKAAANGDRAVEFEAKYTAEYEKRRAAEAELAALKEKMRALVG